MIDKSLYRVLEFASEFDRVRFSDFRFVISNPRTLSRKLRFLLSRGLLVRDEVGYRITGRGLRVLKLMREILDVVESEGGVGVLNIERIPHRYYAPLLDRYSRLLLEYFGDRLLSIVLFGSVGRGDWDENSDIDLLVIVDGWDGVPVWRRVRELYRVRERLRDTREYKSAVRAGFTPIIQHYPLSREEALNFNRVYLDIVLDGIIIYDREGFFSKIIEALRNKLVRYGAKRISLPNGKYYWVIKNVKAGDVYEL